MDYEVSKIKDDFEKVIEYSQGYEVYVLDPLFTTWEKNKEKFIKRFGGLIYEWPEEIEITLSENEKTLRVREFVNHIYNNYNNADLALFVDDNCLSFFENKVSSNRNRVIPKGMKLVKAFKFFEKNPNILRTIQDEASQIIQENKIKGKLCFSVHPLDFLSSSENTYKWRSCHALNDDFRAGNLSYMADSTTFMAYIKGADDVELNAFGPEVKWNSKKWRVLFHVEDNDNIIFAGRQYPFSSKEGLDLILDIYNNLMAEEYPTLSNYRYNGWHNEYIDKYVPPVVGTENLAPIELDEQYLVWNRKIYPLPQIVVDGYKALNYNDILKSSIYDTPYYTTLRYSSYHGNTVSIGHYVGCLRCGAILEDPASMICDTCMSKVGIPNDNRFECENCGNLSDTVYVVKDGSHICVNCFFDACFICEDCEDIYWLEDGAIDIDSDGKVKKRCVSCHEKHIIESEIE